MWMFNIANKGSISLFTIENNMKGASKTITKQLIIQM